jgi:hypothetical protein
LWTADPMLEGSIGRGGEASSERGREGAVSSHDTLGGTTSEAMGYTGSRVSRVTAVDVLMSWPTGWAA